MRRRIGKLGLIAFVICLAVAVGVFAYSGSFLLTMAWSAGTTLLALVVLVLLSGMTVEKKGWERQEDDRIARHREARHADPAHVPRGEFRRRRGLRPVSLGTAIACAAVGVGLVYMLSQVMPGEVVVTLVVGVVILYAVVAGASGSSASARRRGPDE